MHRFRLATLNYSSGLTATVVTLVIGLFATPWLVEWLNPERFGAARTATNLYAMLSLLELGLAGSITPLLARALAKKDDDGLRSTLSAGFRAYLCVTVPIMLVALAMTPLVDRLISISPDYRADLRRAWIVSILVWPTLCLTPLRGLIDTKQEGYRIHLMLTAQSVIITVTSLLLASRGWGITGQLSAIALGSLTFSLAVVWDVHRRHPGLVRAMVMVRPAPESWRAVWGLSRPTLFFNLSGKLGLLTDYIIVGYLIGPVGVTTLDLTQRLSTLAQGQLLGIGNASWAALAEIYAQERYETFRRRIVELTRLVVLVGVAGLGAIVAYNEHFLAVWLRDHAPNGGPWIIVVAALDTLLISVFSLWGWCYSGTGQIGRIVAPVAVGAGFNFLASIVLTMKFGIVGPILGTMVTYVFYCLVYMPIRLNRDFGVSRTELAIGTLVPFAWGVPYTLLLRVASQSHDPAVWLDLITRTTHVGRAHRIAGFVGVAMEMGIAATAFLFFAGRFLLSAEDRQTWMLRLAGLLPKRFRTPAAEPEALESDAPIA